MSGATVAQRIVLAAHGQWVVGSNPIRVIGGVSRPTIIAPVLQRQICHKTRSEKPNSELHTGNEDFKQS